MRLWQFVKIQLLDDGAPKVKFEESRNYEWSAHTASLIACIINHCYRSMKMQASGEKKESLNNNETNNKVYIFRTKPSISSKSLLASLIKEGTHIKLNSGNYIHVQIISHLRTGRE